MSPPQSERCFVATDTAALRAGQVVGKRPISFRYITVNGKLNQKRTDGCKGSQDNGQHNRPNKPLFIGLCKFQYPFQKGKVEEFFFRGFAQGLAV